MKAEDIQGKGTGGERTILKEVLPLETPLGIYFFPIYACNFKCAYCMNSVDKNEHNSVYKENIMSFSLYKKCIDDISQFKDKVKMLRFAGLGEPLLHKNIAQMVEYATQKEVANTVEIITNGSLLTPKIADDLIEAKLDRLSISIQGVESYMYKKIAKYEIDFEKFVSNIRYFYENRRNTKVHIKILDCSLNSEEDKERFYSIFESICDTITIEKVAPLMENVDYSKILPNDDYTVRGNAVEEVDICSFPFYLMQINPDGTVHPCCSNILETPIVGNCYDESVKDIWLGHRNNLFRRKMLGGCSNLDRNSYCTRCRIYKYSLFPEDIILKSDSEKLKKFY